MSRAVAIFVSIAAGVVLAVLSNWLYDFLKEKGISLGKPTLKRFVVTILGFVPFLVLVALPGLWEQGNKIQSANELQAAGAFVEIEQISPPEGTTLAAGSETQVVATVKCYLPSAATSPEVSLKYLTSYVSEHGKNYYVIHSVPAQVGTHRARLAGTMAVPDVSALNGEPFEVGVSLNVLDAERGHAWMVGFDVVTYTVAASN